MCQTATRIAKYEMAKIILKAWIYQRDRQKGQAAGQTLAYALVNHLFLYKAS